MNATLQLLVGSPLVSSSVNSRAVGVQTTASYRRETNIDHTRPASVVDIKWMSIAVPPLAVEVVTRLWRIGR